MKTYKRFAFTIIILLVISSTAGCRIESGSSNEEAEDQNEGTKNTTNFVTIEEYNRIKKGMSYEEVVGIIGFEGKVFDGQDDGDTSSVFAWDGQTPKSFISVSFLNDKMISKMNRGVQ